jgi:diguanylate cyclase
LKANSLSNSDVLRRVLKLMTAHAEDYRPLTYAVWYEYVLQGDRQLCERLEQVVAGNMRLDSAATEEMHARYLVARRQQVVNQAHATILQALETMSSAIGDAHQNTGRFVGQLRDFSAAGNQQPIEPQIFNRSVLTIAQQARQSSDELARVQARLEESEAQVKRMSEDLEQIRSEVYVDALSGLFNRRRFDSALDALVTHALAEHEPLSLLLIDIDHFKQVNDAHGHVFGDQVIRSVSQAIKASVKGRDVAARYGGDEFGVLLPETAEPGAITVAEYIRRVIERRRVSDFAGEIEPLAVTVSVGLATLARSDTVHDLLRRADKALYQAKRNGRNQVVAG